MIEKIKELLIKYKELILYVIFGVVTTIVNMTAYAILVRLMHVDLSLVSSDNNAIWNFFHGEAGHNLTLVLIANIIAWVAGVIVAFTTNKLWVFESKSWNIKLVLKELTGFVGARLFTGVIEWFGLPLLIMAGLSMGLFGIEGLVAKIVVSAVVIVLNYVFSKFIVFKKKKID